MRIFTSILFLCLSLSFNAYTQCNEVRELADFTKVSVACNAQLYLQEGAANTVEIRTKNAKNLPNIVSEIKHETLHIYYKNDCCDDWDLSAFLNQYPKVEIYLTYQSLEALNLTGRIKFKGEDPIRSTNFDLSTEGYITGSLELYTDYFAYEMEGVANIKLKGASENQQIDMEGVGKLDAIAFISQNCKADIDGSAKISVYVQDNLDAKMKGLSKITYEGNPKTVNINKKGFVQVSTTCK